MIKNLLTLPALCILCAGSGMAQKKSPLQATYLHQFGNDDASAGSVSIERLDLRGGLPLINKEDNLLAIGFRYALDRYDFDGTTADWGAVHHVNLGLASRWKVNEDWLWANYGVVGYSAEEGSDKDDGLNFNYISIAEYKVNDRLTIGPGVGFSSKIDQDISIFPIVYIEWEINDEWSLGSGPSEVAAAGANVYLEYTPKVLQDKWMFTTGFYYSGSTYKLSSNATTADGSAEERLASVYAAASYTMDSGVKLSLIGGYHFFQSYGIFDNGGNELSKEILEDAPYVGVSVGFDF
ncbi:MAG: hypothetical protein ACSHX6_12880 [Akkermansiaceae bacterium]